MNTTSRNRVLMLLENSRYPQDPRVRQEALTLVSAGLEVTVISPAASGQRRHECLDGVNVYRFPNPQGGHGMVGYVWEYGYCMLATFMVSLWVFVRRGFDVVHAHNPPDMFVFVAAFYKLFGKRFVFDHHDLSPEMYVARFGGRNRPLVRSVLVWLEKLSCRFADHVIATNESYKAIQMTRGKVPAERITVVRNGPDLNRIKLIDPDPELRRRASTIIGYAGVMGPQDGIDYLLRALGHLVHDLKRKDLLCVLIGSGDQVDKMKALSQDLGVHELVHFTGYLRGNDFLRNLSALDIGVCPDPSNPYNDRSTMIKLMEYMALSKPIVAFDLPEHRVTAANAALYARPNDELDFARNIAELMDDAELRDVMGRRGRQRVETQLAWSLQKPHLLAVYARLGMRLDDAALERGAVPCGDAVGAA